jgi:hypothetical protein
MKRQQEMGIVRVFVTIECWCDIPNRSWPDAGTRGQLWWMPTEDAEPGPDVVSLVRVGDEPHQRRWERLPDGGWAQCGSLVGSYSDCSPPAPWSVLGRCFAGTEHPVIAVSQRLNGLWMIGCGRDAAAAQ